MDQVSLYSVIFYNNVTEAALFKVLKKQFTFISDCPGVPPHTHLNVFSVAASEEWDSSPVYTPNELWNVTAEEMA